jgi:hypothetical protein
MFGIRTRWKAIWNRTLVSPELEVVYQNMVMRDLRALGIEDNFYPVGFAASYGLFYIVLRAAQTWKLGNTLELGAGQSSTLLTRLREVGRIEGSVHTIEHDEAWADRIAAQVRHSVTRVPLRAQVGSAGHRYVGYDFAGAELPRDVELLIVDGPPAGEPNGDHARMAAVQLTDRLAKDGFIVVIDDAERLGEAEVAGEFERELRNRGIAFQGGAVLAAKKQSIIASGKYAAAAYF